MKSTFFPKKLNFLSIIIFYAGRFRFIIPVFLLIGQAIVGQSQQPQVIKKELKLNVPITDTIKSNVPVAYLYPLKKGQVLKVEIQERKFDIKAIILNVTDENNVKEVSSSSNWSQGFEVEKLICIAEEDGIFAVDIRATEVLPNDGDFVLTASLEMKATEKDYQTRQAIDSMTQGLFAIQANDFTRGIEFFRTSGLSWQALGEKYWIGRTKQFIGVAYQAVGDTGKTRDYLKEALTYFDEKYKYSIANTKTALGDNYLVLSDKESAKKEYTDALKNLLEIGSNKAEIIKNVLLNTTNNNNSIESQEKLLNESRKLKDTLSEASILSQIISSISLNSFYSSDEKKKMMEKYVSQAWNLSDEEIYIGTKSWLKASACLGYSDTETSRKALSPYCYDSLLFNRISKNKTREAMTFSLIFWNWIYEDTDTAIFFGKKAINSIQELRQDSQTFEKETQKNFLAQILDAYRELAEALIKKGRFEEAQQVVNLSRNQDFFDFKINSDQNFLTLSLTPHEQELDLVLQKSLNESAKLYQLFEALKSHIDNNEAEKNKHAEELKKLKSDYQKSYVLYYKTLQKIEEELNQPISAKDEIGEVKDSIEMKNSLKYLSETGKKHATIYTIVAQDNFHILFITPEKGAAVKAFSYPIKAVDLNKKIKRFYTTLKNKNLDPYKTGNELYRIIFQAVSTEDKSTTLEKELAKYKPQVLHWSLDGNLRYIPIAALSDENKQFVVEKYETAVFTRAGKESFTRQPQKWTSCLGFGTTINYPDFPGLKAVANEAKNFCNAESKFIKGEFFLDKKFDAKKMESLNSALKPPLLHFSTHFNFRAGDAQSSFLLLGDGTHLSLYDLQNPKYSKLFQGVDQLTAAACETAAFQSDGNGKEIDAFAELAQRLGASSVIATLWKVDDAGTSQLMIEFYRLYSDRIKKNPSALPAKSDILREAQLNLSKLTKKDGATCQSGGNLSGKRSSDPEGSSSESEIYNGFQSKNPEQPCEHPYFWAPFILYGSPR